MLPYETHKNLKKAKQFYFMEQKEHIMLPFQFFY